MSTTQATLLTLPLHLRQRIYQYSGLITGAKITLQPGVDFATSFYHWIIHDHDIEGETYMTSTWASLEQFQITYCLLQTCKQISDEVQSMVYFQNSLIVHMEHLEWGLGFLRRLPSRHCRNLRDLVVILYADDIERYRNWLNIDLPTPIPLNHERILAWQDAITHILSNIEPKTLALHLVCDTGNKQATVEVLQPLLKAAGMLESFELRLSNKRQHHLCDMASAKVAQIMGVPLEPEPSWTFNFLGLPAEVRHAILRYTDLITPYNEIQWNFQHGFYIYRCGICHGPGCHPRYHQRCKFLFCSSFYQYPAISFCNSLYSAYSLRCQCWSSPWPLMLVCRTMYEDALDVLYSNNRIIATPSNRMIRPFCSSNQPLYLDASRFITRHVSSHALHFLRNLELVLPRFDTEFRPDTSSPMYASWHFAIDHLKDHANLDALTLTVHMAFFWSDAASPSDSRFRRQVQRWGDDTAAVLRPYYCLMTPMQALRRVKRFFVFLEWPWHWSPDCALHNPNHKNTLCSTVDKMEVQLEKLVMGEEYDSGALGKAKEVPSYWIEHRYGLRL